MNMIKRWYLYTALLLACTACSSDDDTTTAPPQRGKPSVTLLASVEGLGDNGYNDCMVNGIFGFYEQTGVVVRLLLPTDMAEAETMYQQWLTANAKTDSAVIIVGSGAYEKMVGQATPTLTGSGSRILLTESQANISGVSTVAINRYGVSYLAGAMLGDFPVYILAAAPNVPMLESAIKGFQDGHAAHAGQDATVTVGYLTEGESAFANPGLAYRTMSERMTPGSEPSVYKESVFPLLGGSYVGVQQAMSDNILNAGLLVGMDVDRSGQSNNIPFSLVIHIDRIISNYLNEWRKGQPWLQSSTLGLAQQATDIVVDTHFEPNMLIEVNAYGLSTAEAWQQRYAKYKEEAGRCEEGEKVRR